MLFDLFIGRDARLSKRAFGGAIRLQRGLNVDSGEARQQLARLPLVFQEVAVSLGSCPEQLLDQLRLLLEELDRNSKATPEAWELIGVVAL